ncbi:hypothetical protein GDO81_026819 [Engystomops pustulosus]|uniref:F-box domain-containing protein n=1 Tax=Engystomops pustulosus TaxID=76066 RepID=A0AAV6YKR7_ENGPU|nr:hypothetical protein GDO81_026819 [Engystomops pustulosus]
MAAGPSLLPDSILYHIFLNLGPVDLLSAGLVCRRWYQVSRDEFLWKELFYHHYHVQRHVQRSPGSDSWYDEFQRLSDGAPCVEVERLREHSDQVLHISFSHSGDLCASCSKDCTAKIWSTRHPLSLLHSANMRPHHWNYTQFSQFNSDDTLLLVSGVFVGPHNSCAGEIAVFSLGKVGSNLVTYRMCMLCIIDLLPPQTASIFCPGCGINPTTSLGVGSITRTSCPGTCTAWAGSPPAPCCG